MPISKHIFQIRNTQNTHLLDLIKITKKKKLKYKNKQTKLTTKIQNIKIKLNSNYF